MMSCVMFYDCGQCKHFKMKLSLTLEVTEDSDYIIVTAYYKATNYELQI